MLSRLCSVPDLTVTSADILTSPHNLTNVAAVSVPSGVLKQKNETVEK